MPDDTKQVVRFVVWHPEHKRAYTEPTEIEAWVSAYMAMSSMHVAHPTAAVVKSRGWICSPVTSELHTHDR